MARINRHFFVSDAEIREGEIAIYAGVVPGTPSSLSGRWAAITSLFAGAGNVRISLYDNGTMVTELESRSLPFARRLAREWAKVRGNGLPAPAPVDDLLAEEV